MISVWPGCREKCHKTKSKQLNREWGSRSVFRWPKFLDRSFYDPVHEAHVRLKIWPIIEVKPRGKHMLIRGSGHKFFERGSGNQPCILLKNCVFTPSAEVSFTDIWLICHHFQNSQLLTYKLLIKWKFEVRIMYQFHMQDHDSMYYIHCVCRRSCTFQKIIILWKIAESTL